MPPVPGWLVEGLRVVEKVSGQFFEVTKVTRTRVSMICQDLKRTREFRLDYLHEYCFACNYFECDDCRKNQGPCGDCSLRKVHFDKGPRHDNRRVCELPKFCRRKFLGGWVPLGPPEEAKESERPLPPTRFEREWVI